MRQEQLVEALEMGGGYLRLKGRVYAMLGDLELEPEDSKHGVRISSCPLMDEDGREDRVDLAMAIVESNRTTPPQLVLREGQIADYPIKGSGRFLCLEPNGNLWMIPFNENDPNQRNFRVVYSKGIYQCWVAGPEGLGFLELCTPPYQEGDLKNLNFELDDIPELFKDTYSLLTNHQKQI